ncbi:DASH complex subunit SPC19 [Elsinoe australis]|uniref:DASH complex subunit SPC19 n=1 Tax=Elsinoe australis TaxID=40998 RepID=A0A2P7YG17_9PEZI|nr:DASH complex subunit SPC19 [Elsinoe australis]TKX23779.1 DASH complex subunit SPC19 [Elsinoe australis]
MSSNSTLQGCVSSLRSSMQLLDSSINILESGVSDFSRLSTVLQTTRHFELVSESDLRDAQSSVLNEIQPEVESLLTRVNTYLDKLERREKSLIAKCELQEGRLGRASIGRQSDAKSPGRGSRYGAGGGEGGLKGLEEVKAMQMRQKKERLSYAVGRLEMQASQRERQLRKSMAFQGAD